MEIWYPLFINLLLELNVVIDLPEATIPSDYVKERSDLIKEENQSKFGGKITLSDHEILANECLMYYKKKEVDEGFKDPTKFLPSHNFLEVKHQIEASPVFKIIQMAPKGGVFHAHSTAMTSTLFIFKNMTYEPNLYVCLDGKPMRFYFFKTPNEECNWKLLSELRKNDASVDAIIEEALVLSISQRKSGNDVWGKFEDIFDSIKGLITYKPLFEKHLIRAMDEFYSDNVMFMEIRSPLSGIYDLEGTKYDQLTMAKLYQQISNEYVKTHPKFVGLKIIYAISRGMSSQMLDQRIRVYKKVKAAVPDFVIGFDLTGQEDKLPSLLSHVKQLKALGNEGTSFFFHAGETDWYGHSADDNLYDAVLLKAKRIGHGLALPKHRKLMEIVKQRKIAIELNPISNQVLNFVGDMRNHPGSILFAENMPVVVSSDDPGFWGAKGLSYDFYEAFVGMMSRDADLRALKQLALNSIEYSGLTKLEILKGRRIFDEQWKIFTRDLVNSKLCVERI